MKSGLGSLTVCFCLGIIFTRLFRVSWWPFYILGAIIFIACVLLINKGLSFNILIFSLVFILGILSLKNAYVIPQTGIAKYVFYKNNAIYTIKGFIHSQPIVKNNRVSFVFRVEELQFDRHRYNACGNILVYVSGVSGLSYGEELILRGEIHKPFGLLRVDIAAVMHIKNSFALVRLNKNKGSLIKRLSFYLKDKIEGVFIKRLSPLAASIVDAMVLGEKRRIPAAVYDSMIKSGTVHILVVSGFNVGIVAFMAGIFFKILRIPRRARCLLVALCLVSYCLITGATTPVVRATVMGVFIILGYLLKREPDITNSLSLAALFILIASPKELFSISFQLSFVSVAAIAYLYPKLKAIFKLESVKIKFLKFVFEGCLVSLSAWLGAAGFIAYYFKVVSFVTVLANIFIVPLAALITLSGLSMVMISLALPFLAGPFAAVNEILVIALLKTNDLLIHLPCAYRYL